MKLSTEGKFRLAVRSALAAGLALGHGAAMAQEAAGTDDSVELERVQVTGSRLKRADVEGALPVAVIDREQIELSGNISAADLLRSTVFNSFGSFRQQSGSSAQSLAGLSLHGLGEERTLILIDGRRAPKAPTAGSFQDLNMIPLAAIERIEVLTDGASAIYGSDAIGGVVNIITRQDFEGAQVMYGEGFPTEDGGDTRETSAIMGISADRGNVLFGASMNSRDIVYTSQRPWGAQAGASIFSNNAFVPSLSGFRPVPGCADAGPGFYINPGNGNCAYNFNLVAADEASIENKSLFAKGNYEINDDWSVYSIGSVSRSESFGRYAPSLNDFPFLIPAESPNNDFGEDIYLYHRFAALGNRDDNVESNVYNMTGGVRGTAGIFDLDFGARYTEAKTYTVGRNYVVLPIALQYIIDGTYDIHKPLENEPEVLNSMKATISRVSTWLERELYASASFDMFQMAGGSASMAFGFEYRTEDYSDLYDSLSEGGAIGGSAGSSAGADRTIRSLYAEAAFPVLSNLEVDIAARFDDYSDVGNNTSPKISLRYQPLDKLTLRASYGQGFRAPTMDILSQKPSFSAEPFADEATCAFNGFDYANNVCVDGAGETVPTQVTSTIISNPALKPEESDQYTLGIVVDPANWVDVSLDYWHIEVDELISFISPSDIAARELAGDPIPAGLGITRADRNGDGLLEAVSVIAGFANEGKLETDGLDLKVGTRFDLGAAGRLTNDLLIGYYLSYKLDGGRDQIGDPGTPEYRASLNNVYAISDFSVAYNINYIDAVAIGVEDGVQTGHVPSWLIHDVQANYNTPWNGTLTLGVNNVANRIPEAIAYDGRPYNFYLYDAYGRVPYFRYTQRF